MRICIAVLAAAIIIACAERTPTQPTIVECGQDEARAEGFAAGQASVVCAVPEPIVGNAYPEGSIVWQGRVYVPEAHWTPTEPPTDTPLQWACREVAYAPAALVVVPGSSFREVVATVDGWTPTDAGSESFHYPGDGTMLTSATPHSTQWVERVRQGARELLKC